MPDAIAPKLVRRRLDWVGEDRRARGCTSRQRRQSLLRDARRSDRSLCGAGPQRGQSLSRRSAAARLGSPRRGRANCHVRRRHGPGARHSQRRGRVAHRSDRAQPVQRPGRHDDPDGRRSRHRARRDDLFQRRDQALRHRQLGPRSAGGTAQRPAAELRPEIAQDPDGLRQSGFPERRLPHP